ncbi:hypothetical protein PM3016_4864 [Paenibacillus mucilaginosus 3016]|uniref:Uncharacterized protein n=3 Tax=Paenibacillus mucilaginosus TaxID=61624 RepID=H6NKB6_9BACL|nr:hypothetical protein PM3016_4864 [Paenibacillus mucilaginosus 3016]AFH63947.1 hypothetical protein B2K_25215 [Paenibacillus mucilaginosus K02]WFA22704.1 hypothetical protein ERY13_24310 [Paenibacillus mucilaginosus]
MGSEIAGSELQVSKWRFADAKVRSCRSRDAGSYRLGSDLPEHVRTLEDQGNGGPAAARMSDIYPLIVGISTLKIWGNYPIIEERSMRYGIPK